VKTKLSGKFWLALTLFSLIGQVAWVVENMYLNVFIYKMFNASAADISNMVAASAVAATLTTVFIGALSDKIGKRKIFICGGYILWGISIISFVFLKTEIIEAVFPLTVSAAAMGASLTIILDCVMTFFGSSANDAAFNAWLTDSTDDTNRGSAEGINSMMPLVAMLVVFGGFMFFDLDRAESWTAIFIIIGAVVTVIGLLGIFIIKDPDVLPSDTGYLKNVIYGFKPSVMKENSTLYITLLAFIILNISIQIFMPYLIIYYEVSLGMTDYVFIMAPAIVIAAGVTAFWGKIYDKKGFKLSSYVSLLWLVLGYILLYFFKATAIVFIGSLLMMCGYLSSMAVFGAKIRDLTPEGKSGRLQGVRIFSQVLIPGVIGPTIGKEVLKNADTIVNNDGTTSFVPNENIFLAALVAIAVLLIMLVFIKDRKKARLCELKTPFEEDTDVSWSSEHPNPQFKREDIINLCGKWNLYVKTTDGVKALCDIVVPFAPESRISQIDRELKDGEQYVYEKSFNISKTLDKRQILHFGAVDTIAEVFVNESYVGKNIGGYLPFKFDVTDYLKDGENRIKVLVTDDLDMNLTYGKQRKKRGGMWYTPISGIWQAVWIETVCQNYIDDIKIIPTLTDVKIVTRGGVNEKKIVLSSGEEYEYTGDEITVTLDNPINWTPENPHLYYFTLTCGDDKIESYFALRTVSIKTVNDKPYICLNDKPYFFHGLLDQGYFSDGIYTPYSPRGYEYDVKTVKELGFNMLRKHIKIEPQLFYYYCDKYGVIVFQDMVNSGKYSFLMDTVLPTAGIKKGVSHKANRVRKEFFEESARKTIDLLYNHPSVVYYTIFNEGWGQYDSDRIYKELKAYDGTRIYDTASGWFCTKESDVKSEHVYFKKVNLKSDLEKPLVLSEFGGYSCKLMSNSFNLDETYGYRYFDTKEEMTKALDKLYRDEIIPMIDRGLCATVLTQVSDVEDETNGILTYDRQVIKTDKETMTKLWTDIKRAFEKNI